MLQVDAHPPAGRKLDLDQPARPGTARHFDPGFGEAAARAVLDDILHERLGDAADALERIAVNDHAGPALVGQAHDADLLVVGARGLGLVKSAVLGSVSNYCLHHASTPVAIIGTHAAETIAESVGPVVVGTDGSPAADVALAWAIDWLSLPPAPAGPTRACKETRR